MAFLIIEEHSGIFQTHAQSSGYNPVDDAANFSNR
jgi:hypothetical protein